MKNYDTLSEAVNDLISLGYTANFNLKEDCIDCQEPTLSLQPDEFEIDGVFRFEGPTDPGDETILFAISAIHHKTKGLLVNAYGMYSDSFSAAMITKLRKHQEH